MAQRVDSCEMKETSESSDEIVNVPKKIDDFTTEIEFSPARPDDKMFTLSHCPFHPVSHAVLPSGYSASV